MREEQIQQMVEAGVVLKVRLETREGAFVSDAHVPAFQLMPEVLLWGQRFFQQASW